MIGLRGFRVCSVIVALLGCGDDSPAGLGRTGGDRDPCADPDVEAIEFGGEGAFGVSPEEAFGALEQGCTFPMTWDVAGFDLHTITPTHAETDVSRGGARPGERA